MGCVSSRGAKRQGKTNKRTVVGLEELDERIIEPQPVLLRQVLERVLLVDHLEDVGPDASEPWVLAQAEDSADELIGTYSTLKDGVESFPVKRKPQGG